VKAPLSDWESTEIASHFTVRQYREAVAARDRQAIRGGNPAPWRSAPSRPRRSEDGVRAELITRSKHHNPSGLTRLPQRKPLDPAAPWGLTGSPRPSDQFAAAVRASACQRAAGAFRAERALVRTDAGVGRRL